MSGILGSAGTIPAARALMLVIFAMTGAQQALAETFIVNSTADNPNQSFSEACDTGETVGSEPECTLRAAIQAANFNDQIAADIHFDIADCPGNICVIEIATTTGDFGSLPDIQSPIQIDGSTQPGNEDVCLLDIPNRPAYRIVLQGEASGIGLRMMPGGEETIIRGLNIRNFANAIDIIDSGDSRVECNYLGTDETGTAPGPGNLAYGVLIACNSPGNIIGGPDPSDGNLISANGIDGVKLFAGFTCNPEPIDNMPTDNAVLGNQIGTAADGITPLGNESHGIALFGGSGADGNFIGVLQNGTTVHGNVIGASGNAGIWLDSSPKATKGTENTLILGNHIGTDRSGQADIGNELGGIHVIRGADNRFGGPGDGDTNHIAFNGYGVLITRDVSVGNRIQQNSIYSNVGLGIDLVVHPEEIGGPGPNKLQSAPEIISATRKGTIITATYEVDTESLPLTIEFFFADDDQEEGKTYLASHMHEQAGTTDVSFSVPTSVPGSWLIATATDDEGNTSMFSESAAALDTVDEIFSDRFQ